MGLLESAQVHGTFVSHSLRAASSAEETLDHRIYFAVLTYQSHEELPCVSCAGYDI